MNETTIFKDRKIKTQQKIIDDLRAENQNLKDEVSVLKVELEYAKNLPKDTYEAAQKSILETEAIKAEYEKYIEQAKKAKKEYEKLSRELKAIKVKYNKEMKRLFKDTQKKLEGKISDNNY